MNKADLEKLKRSLPPAPGILRKEEYFNSAVLIPLIMVDGEYNFLFEKRSAHIRQGSEICFPGGEFDPEKDKTFKDTAIRETVEEVGIPGNKISIIGLLDTLIGPAGVTVDSFIGVVDVQNISSLKFDKNEVEKIFLVPVRFFADNEPEEYYVRMEITPFEIDKNGERIDTLPAKDLQLPEKYSKTWRGRKHRIFVYKSSGEIIWGITAALIYEVIRKLNSSK